MDVRTSIGWAIVGAACALACSSSGGGSAPNQFGGAVGASGDVSSGGGVSGRFGGGGASSSAGNANGGGASGSGATGGGSGGTPGPTTSVDDLWQGFAQAACHHYLNCPGEEQVDGVLKATTDLAGCTAAYKKWLMEGVRYAALDKGVAEGALRVNASVLDACYAAVSKCNHPAGIESDQILYENVTPCREMFEGTVPIGGRCNATEECAGETFCNTGEGDAGSCIGTCVPRLAPGSVASNARTCAGPTPTSYTAVANGKCTVLDVHDTVGVGQVCGLNDDNITFGTCPDGYWCAATLLRKPEYSGGSCRPAMPVGTACWEHDTQETLAVCSQGVCSTLDNNCDAYTVLAAGGVCDDYLTICNPFDGLLCDGPIAAPETCRPGKVGGCGGVPWFEQIPCGRYPGPRKDVGQSCNSNDECASGVCDTKHGCLAGLCSGS